MVVLCLQKLIRNGHKLSINFLQVFPILYIVFSMIHRRGQAAKNMEGPRTTYHMSWPQGGGWGGSPNYKLKHRANLPDKSNTVNPVNVWCCGYLSLECSIMKTSMLFTYGSFSPMLILHPQGVIYLIIIAPRPSRFFIFLLLPCNYTYRIKWERPRKEAT